MKRAQVRPPRAAEIVTGLAVLLVIGGFVVTRGGPEPGYADAVSDPPVPSVTSENIVLGDRFTPESDDASPDHASTSD